MKILVTGASGQLGRTIHSLYAEDKEFEFTFVSRNQLDISNSGDVNNIFTNNNFDYCVNCAAYTNVEQAEEERELAFKINSLGTKNLALACSGNSCILIHISTDYVFDGDKTGPYKEDDSPNPINVYGESKLAGENHVQNTLNEYFVIRTSWLYSTFGKNFLKSIISKIEQNQELNIITSQKGTPSSCIDLAHFLIYLVRQDISDYGIYHFTAEGSTTWFGFTEHISRHFPEYDNSKLRPIENFETKASRPANSVLSIEKASSFYNLNHWKESVSEAIEILKKDG